MEQRQRQGRDSREGEHGAMHGESSPIGRLRRLAFNRDAVYVMGVLNVTPDSFSDGGRYADIDAAVAWGERLVREGADILDIGGESTRPGSTPVSVTEELRRVMPVLERLRMAVDVPISIDTYKAEVAEAALGAGAEIVNDISGGRLDPRLLEVAGRAGAYVILGHLRGVPATMQESISFKDVVAEVIGELRESAERAEAAGAHVIVDPGIGFGKTVEHNLELMAHLGTIRQALKRPLCVGASRKSFLGAVCGLPVGERLIPSIAAAAIAVMGGTDIVRVHDVAETVPAVKIALAIRRHRGEGRG